MKDNICPICYQPMDVGDLQFFPCTCGFQLCAFCFNRIQETNNQCPQCRNSYTEANFVRKNNMDVDLQSDDRKKKRRNSQGKALGSKYSRQQLASIRVRRYNLVYVVGLPRVIAQPARLKSFQYFGQYGEIVKVVVNQSTNRATVTAYITFRTKEAATSAIAATDGLVLNGCELRVRFGTTKYCSHFIRNMPCSNPDCMYLHERGPDEDSFTKEDMQVMKEPDVWDHISPEACVAKASTKKVVFPPIWYICHNKEHRIEVSSENPQIYRVQKKRYHQVSTTSHVAVKPCFKPTVSMPVVKDPFNLERFGEMIAEDVGTAKDRSDYIEDTHCTLQQFLMDCGTSRTELESRWSLKSAMQSSFQPQNKQRFVFPTVEIPESVKKAPIPSITLKDVHVPSNTRFSFSLPNVYDLYTCTNLGPDESSSAKKTEQ
ncbi:hypothetical protein PCE1_002288 [Barthelona sp. PCE]